VSRHRKAGLNAIVILPDEIVYAVVIGYRDDVAWGRYLMQRTDALGRTPRGPAFWVDSPSFEITGRTSRPPGRIHRANEKLGPPEMRGCDCNCCVHIRGVADEPDD
jgi:hypothetical protein